MLTENKVYYLLIIADNKIRECKEKFKMKLQNPEQGLGVHMKLSECKLSYYLSAQLAKN